jgi:hypothetical protein
MQPTQGEGPWSSADYRNGSDVESDNAYYGRVMQQALRDAGPGLSESASREEFSAYARREAGFSDDDFVQTATRLDGSNADRLIIHGGPENPARDSAEAIQLMLERKAMRLNASSGSGTGSGTAFGVMSSSAVSALDVSSAQPLEVLSTIPGMDVAEVASLGPVEFQQANDELVATGTYDRFSAMGSAWSDGRYGDFLGHLAFDASDAAKTAAAARSYQPPSLAAQRLDRMLFSPIGTIASLGVKAFGGGQTWQDAALLAGSFGENAVGGALGLPRSVGPAQTRLASSARRLPLGPGSAPTDALGVPSSRAPNPLGVVLEFDAAGNELFYRTMSPKHFRILQRTGQLPATGETFISPMEAYSKGYEGVLVRITVKPGTADKLTGMGVYGNDGTAKLFPDLPASFKGWNQSNAQIKLEATGRPDINNGLGVINTGLGKGPALDTFNQNLLRFERLD